jgi:hypothetical protein
MKALSSALKSNYFQSGSAKHFEIFMRRDLCGSREVSLVHASHCGRIAGWKRFLERLVDKLLKEHTGFTVH